MLHSRWILAGRCRHGWHSRLARIRWLLLLLLRLGWKMWLSLVWWRSELLGLLLLLKRLRRIVGLLAHGWHWLAGSRRSSHSRWWSILHGWLTRDHRWHSGLVRLLLRLLLLLVAIGEAIIRSDGRSGHHARLAAWRRTILKRRLTQLRRLLEASRSNRWGHTGRRAADHRLIRKRGLLVLGWRTTERHVLKLVGKVLRRSPIDGRQRWRCCCLSYALLWPPLGRLPVRTHLGVHRQQTQVMMPLNCCC